MGQTTLPPSVKCLKIWEPQIVATLRASTACTGITLSYLCYQSPLFFLFLQFIYVDYKLHIGFECGTLNEEPELQRMPRVKSHEKMRNKYLLGKYNLPTWHIITCVCFRSKTFSPLETMHPTWLAGLRFKKLMKQADDIHV
jgi:hypothetical protein